MFGASVIRQSLAQTIKASTRSYASASAVQAPITLYGIDGRYATALFTAAAKTNSLDKVESELKRIKSIVDKDANLKSFLETPIMDRIAKKEGVKSLLSQGSYSDITMNFFELLADNGRLDQTLKSISAFSQLMTAHRGEVAVTVTSAKDLDPKVTKQLKDVLTKSDMVEKNQKLIVTNKINPQILGGLIIEIGDKTIDLSVSSKISKLNRLLTEAI
ncbi:hypothetical protein SmJEL517_g00408 [Synchytrium microbalum]|uniref:ATP synthase subunit 5, mitochondrial n=1 Tax=Synchytrium microbalum TaxID=1806994 RepID=A0A507CA67_9FUNG|nr:uncharacterized protein SmJEL517_g00408 [Synchytrium microbalum]TPX37977.1 hypothetical protein SmJEL517_g00408 [Synchytrium microbalum]